MMTALRRILGVMLFASAGAVAAAEGPHLETAHSNRLDLESLQRGARNFVNYCLNCHSAQYMRYNRLTDLGLTEQQIADNLMFATDKVGNPMTVAMSPADAKTWLGASPPDLTVEARVRGKDWLYSYFLAFYRDEKSATGWNNLIFPNVGMPNVLWNLSGSNKLVETEVENRDKAEAIVLHAPGLAVAEPAKGGKFLVKTLEQETQGALSLVEYKAFVADLVNYLDYMSEPVKNERITIGIYVLLYLFVLFVFVYALKREYCKDVH